MLRGLNGTFLSTQRFWLPLLALTLAACLHCRSGPNDSPGHSEGAASGEGGTSGGQGSAGTSATGGIDTPNPSDPIERCNTWSISGPPGEIGSTPCTLYNAGQINLYSVAVDDESVYFAGVTLVQASKEGGGPITALGGSASGIFVIRTGPDHVYWLNGSYLMRAPKLGHETTKPTYQDLELRLGGVPSRERTSPKPEMIPLPWGSSETFLLDDRYIYVAAAGCAAIVRIDQTTLEQSTLRWKTPLEVTTGLTYLYREGSDLYCGAWHGVFRIRNWTTYEELVSTATWVAGLTLAREHLYWLDRTSQSQTGSEGEMWMLDDSAVPMKVADAYTSPVSARDMFFDEPRNRLVWVDTVLLDFPLDSKVWRIWKRSRAVSRGFARDDAYLYWTVSSTKWGTVERIRLDEP